MNLNELTYSLLYFHEILDYYRIIDYSYIITIAQSFRAYSFDHYLENFEYFSNDLNFHTFEQSCYTKYSGLSLRQNFF